MQEKLTNENYRFKVSSCNSYMDPNCSNTVVCIYWKKEMEDKLMSAEELLNETDYDSLITENTEACCADGGCNIF
jgi:hypothetical protein